MANLISGNAYGGKYASELIENAARIIAPGKGILAADESTGTIGKRVKVCHTASKFCVVGSGPCVLAKKYWFNDFTIAGTNPACTVFIPSHLFWCNVSVGCLRC